MDTPQASISAPDDDADLVRKTIAGDDEAFAELVRRHKRSVLRTAARFARSAAELEDLGQEAFFRAYRDLRGFRGDAPFGHWLARVTARACYDALRKRRREERDVSLEGLPVPPADPGTEDGAAAGHARLVLREAMSRLKPEERLVITLFELEGLSAREVAELMGWNETLVKVRAFRARQALKRSIGGGDER